MPVNTAQVDAFAVRLATAGQRMQIEEELWQQRWGSELVSQMRSRAPRQTGALADSIHQDASGNVVVGVPYGGFVEYGTSDTAPQPFMRPAVDQVTPEATRDAGRRAVAAI